MLLHYFFSLYNVITVPYFFTIECCYSPSFFTIECCYSHLFLYYQMLLLTSMTSSSSSIFSVESLNFTDLVIAKTLAEQIYFHRSSPDLVFHNCPTVILSHQGLISSSVPRVFLTAVSLTIVHRVFNVTILPGILYLTSTSENSSFYETDLHTIDSALLRPAYPPSMKVDCQTVKRNLFSSSKSDLSDYCSGAGPLVAGPGGWLGLNVDSGRCCQSPPLASNGEPPTTGAGRNPHF